MARTAESILWWTGVVYYCFKIFPSHSHTNIQFSFQKTIPLAKWGERDFFFFFLLPLQGNFTPWFSLTSVTCFIALCSALHKAIVARSHTGDSCLTIYIDLMVWPLTCHLTLLLEPVPLPNVDRAFKEKCFLSLLSLQLKLEDEDIVSECLEVQEVLSQ